MGITVTSLRVKGFNLDQFVKDYLATAAWVTVDSSSENSEFTKEAKEQAKTECLIFIGMVLHQFGFEKGLELLMTPGNDLGYLAAHDFFLTRNGHGAGFWDKEDHYGEEEATKLTEISKQMDIVDVMHVNGPKSKLTF